MLLPYKQIVDRLFDANGNIKAIGDLNEEYEARERPFLMHDDESKTIAIVCTPELYEAIKNLEAGDETNVMLALAKAYKQFKPILQQLKENMKGG